MMSAAGCAATLKLIGWMMFTAFHGLHSQKSKLIWLMQPTNPIFTLIQIGSPPTPTLMTKSGLSFGTTKFLIKHRVWDNSMLTKPTILGNRINLRPINTGDAEAVFASLSDEESMRLTGTQQSFTFEQVLKFCQTIQSDENRVDFAITRKDDPAYIGEVVLNEIDWENRSANFRIALANHTFFGKGYGSEATQLTLNFAFETLKLHRIELEVYDFNPRALHVYEKADLCVKVSGAMFCCGRENITTPSS
jgi:RimJ/RimL family protein N-acetyltransferase